MSILPRFFQNIAYTKNITSGGMVCLEILVKKMQSIHIKPHY